MTSETNQNGTYAYTYDTYGNIRSVSGAASHTYTYGDSNWLDLLTAYDGKSITYDAIGNPNVWHNGTGDWNLSWANGRQLTKATKGSHIVSYTYDLAGIRDSKTVDGVTYNYLTQNGQVVRQTWGSHVLDIIYDNTGKPYALKYDGTTYYYVLNLQGDVISIISRWGSTEGRYTYDAWGNIIAQSGDIASINPVRYRGYYYDSETGLYYLGSRYYDPQVKRFINADGAAFATFNTYSNGLTDKNYFAYCDNNPTSRSDDGGQLWVETAIGAVTGAFWGGLTAAATGDNIAKGMAIGALSGAASGALSSVKAIKATAGAVLGAAISVGAYRAGGNTNIAGYVSAALTGAASGAISAILPASYGNVAGAVVTHFTTGVSNISTMIASTAYKSAQRRKNHGNGLSKNKLKYVVRNNTFARGKKYYSLRYAKGMVL